jgi:hypothetical protein
MMGDQKDKQAIDSAILFLFIAFFLICEVLSGMEDRRPLPKCSRGRISRPEYPWIAVGYPSITNSYLAQAAYD